MPSPAESAVPDRAEIGVVAQRRRLDNPWADHAWAPAAVLEAALPVPAWTRLLAEERVETYYAGAAELRLYPGETAHYRDNLTSGRPSVWAALHPVAGEDHELGTVTVDPYEGESMAETMGILVEALPMPDAIRAWVEAYVAAHHVERPFLKRKRDRHDPNVLGRRRGGGSGGGTEEGG